LKKEISGDSFLNFAFEEIFKVEDVKNK